ncbi:MAG: helix-turn-helix domain-containing protein [Actinomycetota bacterium]|nr:helix-turn-helix domain-containing protein [Actinomycetota bacterium]
MSEQNSIPNRVELDELLTIGEVAAITRAPISTVRYWRHLGTGPRSFRLGRRVVFRRADLDRWMAERERAARTTNTSPS